MIDQEYYKAIFQIIKTGHLITDQVNCELKEFDITEPQFNVLRILKGRRGNPITVQDIQSQMIQRTSNVTRLVDKLLAKGLVTRSECPTNRRKMDINITPVGEALLKKLNNKVEQFHLPMTDNLTPAEAETLTKLIIKLKGDKE